MNKNKIAITISILTIFTIAGLGCSKSSSDAEVALATKNEESRKLEAGINGEVNEKSVIEKVSKVLKEYYKIDNIKEDDFEIRKSKPVPGIPKDDIKRKNEYWVELDIEGDKELIGTNYSFANHDPNKLKGVLDRVNSELYDNKASYKVVKTPSDEFIEVHNKNSSGGSWQVNYEGEAMRASFCVDEKTGKITSFDTGLLESEKSNMQFDEVKIDIKNEQERVEKIIKPFMESIGLNYGDYEISGYRKSGYANVILSNKKDCKDKIIFNINHKTDAIMVFSTGYIPSFYQESPDDYVCVKKYKVE